MTPASSPPPDSLRHPERPDGVQASPAPPPAATDGRDGGDGGGGGGTLSAVPAWAPFLALVAAFVLLPGIVYALGGLVRSAATFEYEDPGFLVPSTLLLDAGFVACAYLCARAWVAPTRPSTLGLRIPSRRGRSVGLAVAVYVAFLVFTAIYAAIVGQGPEQDLVEKLRGQDSVLVLAGFALLVGIAAPIGEEILFRGLLFGVLREKVGVPFAALVAGGVFGAFHAAGTPIRLLGVLMALGIGLCVLYQWTGSLLPGMGVHAVHNSLSLAATKGLAWWLVLLIVVACAGTVMALMSAVSLRERRAGLAASA